jgi:transcriptional regulator with XRE-family HTH domain
MTDALDAPRVLRLARTSAGLSQRELARRAGTSQSVISRIEAGQTSPTTVTLARILAATGHELDGELVPLAELDESVMADVPRVLALAPEERLTEVANVSRFLASARRV